MEPIKEQAANMEAGSGAKRNFSKYDMSGTDPNRYATVSNKKEADQYLHKLKKSFVPGLRVNISKTERALMLAGGSYLLYKAIRQKDGGLLKGIAAGAMLFRGISGYCPAYDALDKTKVLKKSSNIVINTALTVDKPVQEVYNAWRRLEALPLFMKHLESVTEIDNTTSKWKAKIPGGLGTVTWKAEILMDEPNSLLSWHSVQDATIENSGKVRFREKGSSTELEVTISYKAPLGHAGAVAAKLMNPIFEKLVKSDIDNFKEYIESGKK